jgi:multicomponent Na+:H+ antiporter subunit A
VLTSIGGLTFLWGAVGGLRQADLKQMLAQSTISSLGLLVLLIGIGGEVGAAGAAAYFLTHALYKAGFFLVAGLIDHETGVRDITALGGLREKMALGFIAAILAGLSMLGLPPTLGYLAKEAIYAAPGPEPLAELLLPAVLVVGNAILGALALALVAKPFMGPLVPTPKAPQEGPPAMLLGPLLLGMAGIGAALLVPSTAGLLLAPAATAILGHTAELHMGFGLDLRDPAPWLSVATWLLSAVIFWRLALLRAITRRVEGTFPAMFDRLFDAALSGLLAFAAAGTRLAQNGHLASYLLMVLAATAAALLLPLLFLGGPALPAIAALTPLEWLSVGLAVIGLVTILLAPSLLFGIISLGVQGLAAALIYLEFEAPDVSLTQFMVEVLSVAILALVMTRLHLGRPVQRPVRVALRDGLVAVLCGAGTTAALMAVLDGPFDARLGAFFEANATALAHGHNIVNVILVDFRGLDTLGEISVLMTAAVATVALIATGRRLASRGNGNAGGQNRRRRSRRHKAAPVAAAGPPAPDGAGAAS